MPRPASLPGQGRLPAGASESTWLVTRRWKASDSVTPLPLLCCGQFDLSVNKEGLFDLKAAQYPKLIALGERWEAGVPGQEEGRLLG